ncbi:MAG: hypothetical protein GXY68_13150 [Chloroflexi bacterium]|jgi:hypothetical protein|nr:hypothetical protein [Chloroflexota bacterium]
MESPRKSAVRSFESEYRRGYRDGYSQAIQTMRELTHNAGFSPDEAFHRLFSHWDGPLEDWQLRGLCPDPPFEFPPMAHNA